MPTLLSLGHGYTASHFAATLPSGWQVIGTTRDPARADALRRAGVEPLVWPGQPLAPALGRATHLLVSASPGPLGDPFLAVRRAEIAAAAPYLHWVGYLSSTGVYGDFGGGWVDEDTPPNAPEGHRDRRLLAEGEWQALADEAGLPLHIFRLAGIYGPGRGPFQKVKDGTARRIVKPGQVFSRIHVDDIAQVLAASVARPDPGRIYNVCDDEPAPPQDVIAHAADLLGLPHPPTLAFEDADLSPMARAFYADNRRVRNERIKRELAVVLKYPTYREGLAAILATESGDERT